MTGFHLAGVPLPGDAAKAADDGTTVLEDDTGTPVTRLRPPATTRPARCKCSHAASMHYRDRTGRPTCGSAACGCLTYRPKEDPA